MSPFRRFADGIHDLGGGIFLRFTAISVPRFPARGTFIATSTLYQSKA